MSRFPHWRSASAMAAACILATSCGGKDGTAPDLSDRTAPTVRSVSPAANAAGIRLDSEVQVTFSEPLAPSTVTSTSVQLNGGSVAGGVTVSGAIVTFRPVQPLALGTIYEVRVTTAVTDTAGNALAQDYVSIFSTIASPVSAGVKHTCALTAAAAAYCWGHNSHGQIGDGTSGNNRLRLELVSGGHAFIVVSAGEEHTCALSSAGAAYCWGNNGQGQVGDGTSGTNRPTPTPVTGGHTFAVLSAGDDHTCALTRAGMAYCWGANDRGQIGDGTDQFRTGPTPVSGSHRFVALSAGGVHTCGLTITGAAHCWGGNGNGQLGDGTFGVDRRTPVAVTGSLPFATLGVGAHHSCAVTSTGTAYCWGSNFWGQLGRGTSSILEVTPMPVSGGRTFSGITGGGQHSCGNVLFGAAYCWGYNVDGQLGDGSRTVRFAPALVSGGHVYGVVDGGRFHTCALTSIGAAFCWGINLDGQLGDGSTAVRLVPTAISGSASVGASLGQP